jgi:hypothetical protein
MTKGGARSAGKVISRVIPASASVTCGDLIFRAVMLAATAYLAGLEFLRML